MRKGFDVPIFANKGQVVVEPVTKTQKSKSLTFKLSQFRAVMRGDEPSRVEALQKLLGYSFMQRDPKGLGSGFCDQEKVRKQQKKLSRLQLVSIVNLIQQLIVPLKISHQPRTAAGDLLRALH